jgi:hypothetical protein
MPVLTEPHEIFDIVDGASIDIVVTRIERGDEEEMKATDGHIFRSSPLRLYLTQPVSVGRHPYLDVTSKRLIPMLQGLLAFLPPGGKRIKITKHGVAPVATFTVEALPT